MLGFESLSVPLGAEPEAALDICRASGLRVLEAGARGSSGDAWRSSFVRAPYVREQLVLLGVLVETFETAVTWDRFEVLVAAVTAAVLGGAHVVRVHAVAEMVQVVRVAEATRRHGRIDGSGITS